MFGLENLMTELKTKSDNVLRSIAVEDYGLEASVVQFMTRDELLDQIESIEQGNAVR